MPKQKKQIMTLFIKYITNFCEWVCVCIYIYHKNIKKSDNVENINTHYYNKIMGFWFNNATDSPPK